MSDSAQKLVIRNIGLMLSGKMEAPSTRLIASSPTLAKSWSGVARPI